MNDDINMTTTNNDRDAQCVSILFIRVLRIHRNHKRENYDGLRLLRDN